MEFATLHHPWGLRLVLPFYKIAARIAPKRFARARDAKASPHASVMLCEGNWLYRLIFPHFFKKMRFELPADVDLATYAQEGTIIYIGTHIQPLEYNYFAHLFDELNLPRAVYANGISLRRWMKWPQFTATLAAQLDTIAQYGGVPHPATTGELADMIARGDSVFFTLAASEMEADTPHASESHQLLSAVIQAQRNSTKPIYLVPVTFVWDRRPQKTERSLIDILFGEKDSPGAFRKIVLFWRNYKTRAVVKIETPVDCTAFAMERPDATDDALAAHMHERLLTSLTAKRRAITGPPLRPQQWFVERVMADPHLEKHLAAVAVEHNKTLERISALARRNVKEIAANMNYTYLELLRKLVGWVFNNLYENVSVDTETLARVKELSAFTPLTFVPSHKSHLDYLLLSYILDQNNMTAPHIAAGMNLAFWPLGPFFRRCGAYFIRRSFRRNPVYRDVLTTYIAVLLHEGYNQEFFIEGGRSRTGKLRPPRLGMLSMMADAVIAGKEKDLIFVPVAISYDRVLEHGAYTHEVTGGTKKAEKVRDILGLTKFLRRQKEKRGTIYVRFGTPVSISGAMHELGINAPLPPERKREVTQELANQICHEINTRAVATPLALAAMALLLKPKRAVSVADFKERTAAYLDYLAERNAEISESLKIDAKQGMDDAIAYLIRTRMLRSHDDPEFPFYEVMEDKRIALDYYKNTALHFFAALAILCRVLKKRSETTPTFSLNDIADSVDFLQSLFQFEFRFNQRRPLEQRIEWPLTFLITKGAVVRTPDGHFEMTSRASAVLDNYAELITNVIDAYGGALIVLGRETDKATYERDLIRDMLAIGPNLFLIGKMSHREAISKENFTHALAAFHALGAIRYDTSKQNDERARRIIVDHEHVSNLQAKLERVI